MMMQKSIRNLLSCFVVLTLASVVYAAGDTDPIWDDSQGLGAGQPSTPLKNDSSPSPEDMLEQELNQSPTNSKADSQPTEAPYPGANTEFSEDLLTKEIPTSEAPKAATATPAPTTSQPQAQARQGNLNTLGTPQKKGTHYIQHPDAAKGLIRIEKDGTYVYKNAYTRSDNSVDIRVGAIEAPKITAKNGLTYNEIYGGGSDPILLVDYEWRALQGYGHLGVVAGTGFFTATGKGRFKKDPTRKAEESYSFFAMPNHLSLIYRFQFARKQWFVPYVMGGGNYFTMVEMRDDGVPPKAAGATAVSGSGGFLISLNGLDKYTGGILASEYGISNMWFSMEYKAIKGLKSDYDFTSNVLNGGITMDF